MTMPLFPLPEALPDEPSSVSLGGHIITTKAQFARRRDNEFYPTPLALCVGALDLLPKDFEPMRILDPGAGTGVWSLAARLRWPIPVITGVEIREDAGQPEHVDKWLHGSFTEMTNLGEFDLVIGNPPYGDPEDERNKRAKKEAKKRGEKWVKPERQTARADAVAFIRHGMKHLRDGGYLMFLLRLAFLESRKRQKLFREYPPFAVDVLVDRVSFTDDGHTDAAAYAIVTWRKGYADKRFNGGFLDWKPYEHQAPLW